MSTTIRDLADGETTTMKGSGKNPYVLRNIGGVYDCSCPAWRNQSHAIDVRTCKHLVKLLGVQAELNRVGFDALPTAVKKKLGKPTGAQPARAAVKTKKKQKAAVVRAATHAFLLAHNYDDRDPTGLRMSEKLDGVRAKWIAKDRQFISRLGNVFFAPDFFTAGLPNHDLDGELFIGRGLFQRTVSVVRRANGDELWREVRFCAFDLPTMDAPFTKRLAKLKRVLKGVAFAEVVAHKTCRSRAHLDKELEKIIQLGGEGLMLREPDSLYEGNRSTTLLKVKKWHDAEATVIGHEPGKGRHKGRLGALLCEMACGKTFKVGTGFTDAEREAPPAISTTITYKYQELTKAGVPRFPAFLRIRED
jgi:DNA ligase-1